MYLPHSLLFNQNRKTMTKKYVSKTSNLTIGGIIFKTYSNRCGSYYMTSDVAKQKELEKSPFFGKLFKVEEYKTVAVEVEKKVEAKPTNVYKTSSFQEARQIIMDERKKRDLPYKTYSNIRSLVKAAEELGLEFPNLKVK